jgi:hypothetical protein
MSGTPHLREKQAGSSLITAACDKATVEAYHDASLPHIARLVEERLFFQDAIDTGMTKFRDV